MKLSNRSPPYNGLQFQQQGHTGKRGEDFAYLERTAGWDPAVRDAVPGRPLGLRLSTDPRPACLHLLAANVPPETGSGQNAAPKLMNTVRGVRMRVWAGLVLSGHTSGGAGRSSGGGGALLLQYLCCTWPCILLQLVLGWFCWLNTVSSWRTVGPPTPRSGAPPNGPPKHIKNRRNPPKGNIPHNRR